MYPDGEKDSIPIAIGINTQFSLKKSYGQYSMFGNARLFTALQPNSLAAGQPPTTLIVN